MERAVSSDSSVMIECNGTEMTITSCPSQIIHSNTICQLILVHCEDSDDKDEETPVISSSGDGDGDSDGDGSGGGGGGGGGGGDGGDGSGSGGDVDSDNGSGSSSSPPETTTDDDITISTIDKVKPSSVDDESIPIDVFVGVAAAILIGIVLIILTTILIVYMKQRNKQITAVWIEDATKTQQNIETSSNGKGEKHLDNPTYDESIENPPECPDDDEVEHNVVNPLYDMMKTESGEHKTDSQLYAILECPSYAVPGEVIVPTNPAAYETVTDVNHGADIANNVNEYDYADIPKMSHVC